MNAQECLAKLVPPGQHRPNKMGGGGVMQIQVTRACTEACRNCTQGSNLGGKTYFMSPEQFEQAVLSLRGYPWIIAIFGGQPTLSPHFPAYCEILTKYVRHDKRGLWTNALNGHGTICRRTFLPESCNLNVHMSRDNYDEFRRDWPEARPFGLDGDSRHSPVFVAMNDVVADESKRWELISTCDINRDWSALIGLFRGQLRGYFCEIAYSQSALHQDDPDYPDTGLDVNKDYFLHGQKVKWWQLPMYFFRGQVEKQCHECSVPLRGFGSLALDGDACDQVSQTHADVYKPKRKGHKVEIVTTSEQLGSTLKTVLDYIGNANRPKHDVVR